MSNEVTIIESLNPLVVFSGGLDDILAKIATETKSILTDVSTEKGRKEIASIAYKVAKAKTLIDETGKKLGEEAKATVDKINADRKKARDFLDNLKEEIRKPLTDFENAEKERIANHEFNIKKIEQLAFFDGLPTSTEVTDRLNFLAILDTSGYQEFTTRAVLAQESSIAKLNANLITATQRETEAEELAKLRDEKLAREQKDRDDLIAKEAAEKERKNAEEIIKKIEDEKAIAEQKAKEAIDAAIEAERSRIAAQQQAEAAELTKRESDKKHKAKIHNEILAVLAEMGLTDDLAKSVISAIALGQVPHVKIAY